MNACMYSCIQVFIIISQNLCIAIRHYYQSPGPHHQTDFVIANSSDILLGNIITCIKVILI